MDSSSGPPSDPRGPFWHRPLHLSEQGRLCPLLGWDSYMAHCSQLSCAPGGPAPEFNGTCKVHTVAGGQQVTRALAGSMGFTAMSIVLSF